jgi:hypothetical protein
LTAATAALGVSAALLAGNACRVANWFLLLGSGLIIGAEDACREVEVDARLLAKVPGAKLREARRDVLSTHRPRLLIAAVALGLAAMVAGFVLRTT